MKKIKILLILCIIFIFSGCSVNYSININETNPVFCTEEVIIKSFDSDIVGTSFDEFINLIYSKVNGVYEINSNDKNNITIKKNACNIYDLSNSKILENYVVDYEIKDGYINLSLDGEELGNLIIIDNGEEKVKTGLTINFIINVPYKVTSTNAKKRNGNNYIWTFDNENNITDISLKYDSSKLDKKLTNEQMIIISVGFLLSLILLTVLFVTIKHKAANR